MGLFSEIATEGTLQLVLRDIKLELQSATSEETQAALKNVGKKALTYFEWTAPEWAVEYETLFK